MFMSKRLVKIGEAAALIGSTPGTLRKWEATGELLPARKTLGGTRYYDVNQLLQLGDVDAPTIGYARVSSHDQKADLDRQHELLEAYCSAKGWRTEIIRDLGSGMNYSKKGLKRLLEMILRKQMRRLVLTHKDRLLRVGAELVFTLCELQGIEVVLIHKGEQPRVEEELTQDVLEIITVFSARLYGSRSKNQRQLLADLQAAGDKMAAEIGILSGTERTL
jgi:predicted site-specific integrase-resolvase